MRRRCLTHTRRHVVARFFAMTLIALTVVPFTAPFSAVDVIELMTEPGHGGQSGANLAKDVAAPPAPALDLFVVLLTPVLDHDRPLADLHLQRLKTIVLRV